MDCCAAMIEEDGLAALAVAAILVVVDHRQGVHQRLSHWQTQCVRRAKAPQASYRGHVEKELVVRPAALSTRLAGRLQGLEIARPGGYDLAASVCRDVDDLVVAARISLRFEIASRRI